MKIIYILAAIVLFMIVYFLLYQYSLLPYALDKRIPYRVGESAKDAAITRFGARAPGIMLSDSPELVDNVWVIRVDDVSPIPTVSGYRSFIVSIKDKTFEIITIVPEVLKLQNKKAQP